MIPKYLRRSIYFLILFATLAICSCSKNEEPSIVGKWDGFLPDYYSLCGIAPQIVSKDPYYFGNGKLPSSSITFYENGTFTDNVSYSYLEGWLHTPYPPYKTVEEGREIFKGTYVLNGDKLTIKDHYSSTTYIITISEHKLSITDSEQTRVYTRGLE